jgi:acetoin:2,6-dichlorophenolindophenol oxidoreductase subunit alpha
MSGIEKSAIDAIEADIRQEFEDAVEFSKNSREITMAEFEEFAANY